MLSRGERVKVWKSISGLPITIQIEFFKKDIPGKVVTIVTTQKDLSKSQMNSIVEKCKKSYKEGLNIVI